MEQFLQQDPVCNIVLNRRDGRFLYIDQNFKDMFGSSLSVLLLVSTVTEFFCVRKQVNVVLERKGSTWFRGTMHHKGIRYKLRAFTRLFSPEVEHTSFQLELDNVVKDGALDRILV
eukprot:maker-scaffold_53-snap-gene-1.15-mRNA-1 protein AED:0.35 eAED:0.38 QI:0/0/0.5/1/1/1/2/75/115